MKLFKDPTPDGARLVVGGLFFAGMVVVGLEAYSGEVVGANNLWRAGWVAALTAVSWWTLQRADEQPDNASTRLLRHAALNLSVAMQIGIVIL